MQKLLPDNSRHLAEGFEPEQGRQSLSHHNSRVRTAACSTRWATIHQIPNPASARPIAASPPASDEAKVTFDNSAKRNCLTQIVF